MRQVPWVPHCFIMSVVLGEAYGPTIDLVTQVYPVSHSSPQCHQAPKVEFLGGRKPIPKERGVDVAGAIESVH